MKELTPSECNFISGGNYYVDYIGEPFLLNGEPIFLNKTAILMFGTPALFAGAMVGTQIYPVLGTLVGAALGASLPVLLQLSTDGVIHIYQSLELIN